MDVAIRELPERRIGTIPHRGPYHQIGQAFQRLSEIAGAAGLFANPGAAMVALYHDDPESTPPDQLRSDAGIVVPPTAPLPEGLTEQRLEAGRFACTVHEGSYQRLGDTWVWLRGEWLAASGHRVRPGPSFELYLNTPMTAAEADLRTEVCAPIA